MSILQN